MVLACHEHKFIFLKTFKTASTSVEGYLEPFCLPPGEETGTKTRPASVTEYGIVGGRGGSAVDANSEWQGHMTAKECREKMDADMWSNYYKFITIRNPFPRLVSAFQVKGLDGKESIELDFEVQKERFKPWLLTTRSALSDIDRYMIDGEVVIDDAIRFEHMNEDLARILAHLNMPAFEEDRMPHFRASKNRKKARLPYQEYYDDETEAFIRETFAWEIEKFGYNNDQPDQHFMDADRYAKKAKRQARAIRRAEKAAANEASS